MGWAWVGHVFQIGPGRCCIELHCMSAGAQEYLSLCATNEFYIKYNTN